MNFRPYQTEAVSATIEGFKAFNRQLLVAPTGAGKTLLIAGIASHYLPGKTLVLCHREELINQSVDKIHKVTGILPEIEKAESHASKEAQIVVASVQTMARRKENWDPFHFHLVVADECHHSISDQWQDVLSYFNGKILGVTATPDRGDKKELGSFYQNISYEINLMDLIRQKYLSKIHVKSVPLSINLAGVKKTMGDFNETDLGNALDPYLAEIAKEIKTHAKDRKVLVFLPLIATSKKFTMACLQEGLEATHVDGSIPHRKQILEAFDKAKTGVLCNAMLLTEGYDCPSIDCIIVLRPTQSRPLFSQMVGRGTRIFEGKKNLLLLDFLWQHERHSLIHPANLVAESKEEAEQMTQMIMNMPEDGDIEEVQKNVQAEREESLRRELAAKARKFAKNVDAISFCLSLHDVNLAQYVPIMAWHSEPVTEGQAKFLNTQGINPETITCKGQASQIINKLIMRRKLKLATPKQVKYLEKYSHPNPMEATLAEAKEFLDKAFA